MSPEGAGEVSAGGAEVIAGGVGEVSAGDGGELVDLFPLAALSMM